MTIRKSLSGFVSASFLLAGSGSALSQPQPAWILETPANSPAGRYDAGMAYDQMRQQVVLFGGRGNGNTLYAQILYDTWVWDGANWTQKQAYGPGPREGALMAYDAKHQRTVLFGGSGIDNGFFGQIFDTWLWDGTQWTQAFPSTVPQYAQARAITYDDALQEVLLASGGIWAWDGSNWTLKSAYPFLVAQTTALSMAYDAAHQQLVLLAETSGSQSLTFVWNGTTWTELFPVNNPSPGTMVYDTARQQIIVVESGQSRQVWDWTGTNWILESGNNNPLGNDGALAYDSSHQEVVYFGGFELGWSTAQTWVYVPENLLQVTLTAAPDSSIYGRPVTLTANVSPAGATGMVTFYTGATILGTAPVIGGVAQMTTIGLPSGSYSVYAHYSGDSTYPPRTSIRTLQTVKTLPSHSFVSAAGSPVSVGFAPFAAVVGDFNGDNRADLAVVNVGDQNVTVLLGDGEGRFSRAPGSPLPVGLGPFALAVGDFNGDGKQDLAVANSGANSVTILLGDGRGGFTPSPGGPVPTGSGPISVAVADFNGDGKADLAVANSGENTVSIMLGNGSGGFSPGGNSPVRLLGFPSYIAAGDFNLDGVPDLVVTEEFNGYANLLTGEGGGLFYQTNRLQVRWGPVSIAVGNFNGGQFAIANLTTNTVTVLGGMITSGPFPGGVSPECVAAGDFNGDGTLDLAIANSDSDNVTIALGNPDGSFTAATGSPYAAGSRPFFVATADFNGDGIVDLAVVNFTSGGVTILLGKP